MIFCVTILRELYHSSVYVLCPEYLQFKRDKCVLTDPPNFSPKVFAFFQVMQSRELVFVDSTSNLDEHNLRFFLLCIHSIAGTLPLGKKMFSRIFIFCNPHTNVIHLVLKQTKIQFG